MPQVVIGLIVSFFIQGLAASFAPDPEYPAVKDLSSPSADAGRPIPVVFGRMEVKGLNVLGYWDSETYKSYV